MVNSNQDAALFIHSVLQPELEDAYLSWNFFDSYLQQKEYFSSYVFIDKIEEILNKDLKLKKEYEQKKRKMLLLPVQSGTSYILFIKEVLISKKATIDYLFTSNKTILIIFN